MLMKLQTFEIGGSEQAAPVIPDLVSERLVRRSSKSELRSRVDKFCPSFATDDFSFPRTITQAIEIALPSASSRTMRVALRKKVFATALTLFDPPAYSPASPSREHGS